jgi:hypothetical protein
MTLREAIGIGPLQMMQGIETKDNQAYDWRVSVAAGEEFEVNSVSTRMFLFNY